MNKAKKPLLKTWMLLCLFLLGYPARADIVYPARLQFSETAPGLFEVVFILPVINGKILKAQPVFPEFCSPVSDPVVQVDAFQKKSRWEMRCEKISLHGEQIGINGLLGSPIDIILEVTTLEGRTYQTTLSPNEAFYLIPPPPGLSEFLTFGTMKGTRGMLWQWCLAFMFLAGFLKRPVLPFSWMLLAAISGASIGSFLSARELLLVPSWAGEVTALLVSLVLLLPRAPGQENGRPLKSGLVLLGLGALLIGGMLPEEMGLSGYTTAEMAVLKFFEILGIALGVLLLGLLVRQALLVLALTKNGLKIPLARGFAALSLGVLLWKLSLFWNYPSMLPSIPWAITGIVASLALWTVCLPRNEKGAVPVWLLPAFALGYLWGLREIEIPFARAFLLALTAVYPILILSGRWRFGPVQKGLMVLGGVAAGNYLFRHADATLSYPVARSVFFAVLLLLISICFIVFSGWNSAPASSKRYRSVTAIALLLFAFVSGGFLLLDAYRDSLGFSLPEGKLPLPFLSAGLMLLGLLLWPRHRKIHRQMGMERKAPVASLALITVAFFLLPVCLEIRNPWYRPEKMDEQALIGLMERRLRNTYTAFNIADEEALFEQLADNLDEGLLDHIYLDSRRRLTMGLREGSRVTVKDVSLGELGTPESGVSEAGGWKYPATWTVTAQVKHLKHIHYRRNQYTGTIALKPLENGWKISEIILTSEDRQVIASGSL
jgi:hypothetical protein